MDRNVAYDIDAPTSQQHEEPANKIQEAVNYHVSIVLKRS